MSLTSLRHALYPLAICIVASALTLVLGTYSIRNNAARNSCHPAVCDVTPYFVGAPSFYNISLGLGNGTVTWCTFADSSLKPTSLEVECFYDPGKGPCPSLECYAQAKFAAAYRMAVASWILSSLLISLLVSYICWGVTRCTAPDVTIERLP